ncbi:DUF3341 domain-containing protein [bacterium]|nr:DUF3341 domain-containing protein [bacterium]
MDKAVEPKIFGLIAEFTTVETLLEAAKKVRDAGYKNTDTYSPFPVEEALDCLGQHHSRIAWLILLGGITGLASAFGLQFFVAVIDYPINVGGRPLFSWPMYFPIMFELTVLLSVFTAVFGMIGLNRLPQPYHPLFNVPEFARASKDSFFIGIESTDPKFDLAGTKSFLQSLHPRGVHEVQP